MPARILKVTPEALRAKFMALIDEVPADDDELTTEVLKASRRLYERLSEDLEAGSTNADL